MKTCFFIVLKIIIIDHFTTVKFTTHYILTTDFGEYFGISTLLNYYLTNIRHFIWERQN